MNDFKKLNISDRNKIIEEVAKFFENKGLEVEVNQTFITKGHISRLFYIIENEEKSLDFYFLKEGQTTISPGQNSLNIEIAKHILSTLVTCDSPQNTITLKNVKEEKFKILIELIMEEENFLSGNMLDVTNSNIVKYLYNLCGKNGDKIKVTYYHTGTLLIQGRPLMLFGIVSCIVTELLVEETSEISRIFNQAYTLNITDEEVKTKCKQLMPNIDKIKNETLKMVIYQAVFNTFIESHLNYDATFLMAPTFKAVEGQIKEICFLENIEIPKDDKGNSVVGKLYAYDGTVHKLKSKIIVRDSSIKKSLEELYDYYSKVRNRDSHWKDRNNVGIEMTPVIDKIPTAKTYIFDILEKIDYYYSI